eukprot:GHVT01069262.1.p1 GENE.GHVT01069262.1~~GHVT01069262.1.p1  ORF type:complete len:363 (-),score=35.63 GHVT01069262.1:2753-3841(-)
MSPLAISFGTITRHFPSYRFSRVALVAALGVVIIASAVVPCNAWFGSNKKAQAKAQSSDSKSKSVANPERPIPYFVDMIFNTETAAYNPLLEHTPALRENLKEIREYYDTVKAKNPSKFVKPVHDDFVDSYGTRSTQFKWLIKHASMYFYDTDKFNNPLIIMEIGKMQLKELQKFEGTELRKMFRYLAEVFFLRAHPFKGVRSHVIVDCTNAIRMGIGAFFAGHMDLVDSALQGINDPATKFSEMGMTNTVKNMFFSNVVLPVRPILRSIRKKQEKMNPEIKIDYYTNENSKKIMNITSIDVARFPTELGGALKTPINNSEFHQFMQLYISTLNKVAQVAESINFVDPSKSQTTSIANDNQS